VKKLSQLSPKDIKKVFKILKELGIVRGVKKIKLKKQIPPSKKLLKELRKAGIKDLSYITGSPSGGELRGKSIYIVKSLPAHEQLRILLHEAIHTKQPTKTYARVARELRRRGISLPEEILISKFSRMWEREAYLGESLALIRFLRLLRKESPQLYEKIMRQIQQETRANPKEVLLRLGEVSRQTWKEIEKTF